MVKAQGEEDLTFKRWGDSNVQNNIQNRLNYNVDPQVYYVGVIGPSSLKQA